MLLPLGPGGSDRTAREYVYVDEYNVYKYICIYTLIDHAKASRDYTPNAIKLCIAFTYIYTYSL